MSNLNLEKEFIATLRDLNNKEQDSIRIFSAMYVNSYENLKKEKIESLEKNITEQIEFYGRKKDEFLAQCNQIIEKYSNEIDMIINQYNTWFCAIISKLQDSYNNQKISMTNTKLSIDSKNEVKKIASEYRTTNYELIIQECKSQLEECKQAMENKVNEIFYNKDKSLAIRKKNIFQKIINIFTGKSKVNNFVINSLNVEINKLEDTVNSECKNIENNTINKIAIIEDAILQTQTIFKNMLKEYGYNE